MVISLFEKFALLERNLNNLKEELKNYLSISIFLEKKECDLNSPKEFIEYIERNNLFNSIYEIMRFERNLFLYNGKNLKKIIKKIICNNFKNFILNSDEDTRDNMKKFLAKNTKFYNFVDYNQFLDEESDENTKKNLDDIFNNFIILCYIKEKINENNFMNELENNFGIYFNIDEIIEKLNKIINNVDLYFSNELDYFYQSVWNNIENSFKDLFILYNNINKIPHKYLYDSNPFFINDFRLINERRLFHFTIDDLMTINLSDWVIYRVGSFFSHKINDYKKKNPYSFDQLYNMDLNNLKLLYLYSSQGMKKSINPYNKKLSSIESIFIKCIFNNNTED